VTDHPLQFADWRKVSQEVLTRYLDLGWDFHKAPDDDTLSRLQEHLHLTGEFIIVPDASSETGNVLLPMPRNALPPSFRARIYNPGTCVNETALLYLKLNAWTPREAALLAIGLDPRETSGIPEDADFDLDAFSIGQRDEFEFVRIMTTDGLGWRRVPTRNGILFWDRGADSDETPFIVIDQLGDALSDIVSASRRGLEQRYIDLMLLFASKDIQTTRASRTEILSWLKEWGVIPPWLDWAKENGLIRSEEPLSTSVMADGEQSRLRRDSNASLDKKSVYERLNQLKSSGHKEPTKQAATEFDVSRSYIRRVVREVKERMSEEATRFTTLESQLGAVTSSARKK